MDEDRRHRVGRRGIGQARRHLAAHRGQHGHLITGLQRHPVRHARAVRHARDDGPVREGAVTVRRPVDDRAQERDVVRSRRFGSRDAAAVRPGTLIAVRIGDGEAARVGLPVEARPLAHLLAARFRVVAVQQQGQCVGRRAARQPHDECARQPADLEFAVHYIGHGHMALLYKRHHRSTACSPGQHPQAPAAIPRAELSTTMITPPTVIARNDRAKLVRKNLRRSPARTTSSLATTAAATPIAAP